MKVVFEHPKSVLVLLLSPLLISACYSGAFQHPGSTPTATPTSTTTSSPSPSPSASASPSPSPTNVMTVQVGGASLCGGGVNIPCTSVTICVPGTSTCQTISDILVDTGSYGLRVFSSAITNASLSAGLSQIVDSGNSLAECAQFGSANAWGSIVSADVYMGGEALPATVPIQLIDSTFGTAPSQCASNLASPAAAGFNGILGVGLFAQDCGSACVSPNTPPTWYFNCSGTSCPLTAVNAALANQVTNPVAFLSTDNNGVILSFPSVPTNGSSQVTGSLILGIGTATNNAAAGTAYPADGYAEFTTTFNSQTLANSFIDSGSNGLFFPGPTGLTTCSGNSWFCPSNTVNYSATMTGAGGSPNGVVSFSIANTNTLMGTGNSAFSTLGMNYPVSAGSYTFDWGLPFFFGRTVYVGISGQTISGFAGGVTATGPFWAF